MIEMIYLREDVGLGGTGLLSSFSLGDRFGDYQGEKSVTLGLTQFEIIFYL